MSEQLRQIVNMRLQRDGRAFVAQNTYERYGMNLDEFLAWCSEQGYEAQPPLFVGGLFELRTGRAKAGSSAAERQA